ncbi:MAG: rod shape-determining protein MreC [Bdellovibrionales bacterium]|nr:rod shape-determining protein MreC [Bdellovibrionales bacterium]MBT3526565.1 rod shape-determining protein MreC [Bdellovibrionales bacterium]MBT7669768.1 rod shape-determining protein MreC [Bdellovibrionales bacterium]MBT7766279.1 rod shape-determining protein MreC [Bdellovibrionales bacterium]
MNTLEMSSRRAKIVLHVIVLSMALYSTAVRDGAVQESSPFERMIINSVASIQQGISGVSGIIFQLVEDYVANINASQRNRRLTTTVQELQREIFYLDELKRENQRLKGLLKFGAEIKPQKVLARVVSWDSSSEFKALRINKGLKDGIKLQSPVVTAEGVVGYIYRLTEHFADVLTVLDGNNRVDGMIKRTRTHGIIEGFQRGRCQMKYVARTAPVILNDIVITAGLGNIYPKGIPIGTISRIEQENYGILQQVEITPAVNFNRLEEVAVLVTTSKQNKSLEWRVLDQKQ